MARLSLMHVLRRPHLLLKKYQVKQTDEFIAEGTGWTELGLKNLLAGGGFDIRNIRTGDLLDICGVEFGGECHYKGHLRRFEPGAGGP